MKTKESMFNEKTITVKKFSTRQILSLVDGFNQVRDSLGLDPEKVEFSQEFLSGLFTKIAGSIKLENGAPVGPAATALTTFGELVGLTLDEILDGSPDDLYTVISDLWEINASGPFGLKIRLIIATYWPRLKRMMTSLVDTLELNLASAAIPAALFGRTDEPGLMESSFQSVESSDGPSDIALTDAGLMNSSPSNPALDTSTNENPTTANGAITTDPEPMHRNNLA